MARGFSTDFIYPVHSRFAEKANRRSRLSEPDSTARGRSYKPRNLAKSVTVE
jgi:hypothetical protein